MTGPSLSPPQPVRRSVMRMHWLNLTFLHWGYPVEAVQALLPSGLAVDAFDGQAWVGLVPFEMRVGLPRAPYLPWLSYFPETNVRTYVRYPDGRSGVWFFSLDAGRLPAVLTARATYRLPYEWSRMSVQRSSTAIRYSCVRRWPDRPGARSTVVVEPGAAVPLADVSAFEAYLTARFALFGSFGPRLSFARADHPPWPLRRARLQELDDELVVATGLPAPQGDPVAHYSDGVPVRIGLPELLVR